jgi:hypothetical protein
MSLGGPRGRLFFRAMASAKFAPRPTHGRIDVSVRARDGARTCNRDAGCALIGAVHFPMNTTQQAILGALATSSFPLTITDLLQRTGIDVNPPAIRRALGQLARLGLVTRVGTDHALRALWVSTERRERAPLSLEKDEDAVARSLLVKILGLLGSTHEGEVLNAARLAEEQRKRIGKTWAELLG